jgi:molecular chaperone DnaJ
VISRLTQIYSTRYDVTLGFSEAIFGTEKDIILSHLETCDTCSGSGSKVGSKAKICSTCGGRGQVMRTEQTPFGLFSQVTMEYAGNCVSFHVIMK